MNQDLSILKVIIGVIKREITTDELKILGITEIKYSNRNKWVHYLISSDDYMTKIFNIAIGKLDMSKDELEKLFDEVKR